MLNDTSYEGGCSCGQVRYRLDAEPMIVHACHCRDCQRRTGAPLAVNAWIEEAHFELLSGSLDVRTGPGGDSGKPADTASCTACGTAIWTWFHASPPGSRFVRCGTLNEPGRLPPDVHIYTASRQPWVGIPPDVPSFEGFYDLKTTWPSASRQRLRALIDAARGGSGA